MNDISPSDWNFDNLPDKELVACCYWEYARESEFIRDLRRQSWECWKPANGVAGGLTFVQERQLHENLMRAQSIGYPAEVFLRGMSFPPRRRQIVRRGKHPDAPHITGSFPQPWQSLRAEERAERSHIRSDVECVPLVPFKRSHDLDARDIAQWVTVRHREQLSDHERAPDAAKAQMGLSDIQPSLFWESGKEVTVVAIEWASFTNDEIAGHFRRWLKANRPAWLAGPHRKGHKPGDWRARLTRLAVMRLLSRFRLRDIFDGRVELAASVWESGQFSGSKWQDTAKWHDARREAGRIFRILFPFLPENELPRSWKSRASGK